MGRCARLLAGVGALFAAWLAFETRRATENQLPLYIQLFNSAVPSEVSAIAIPLSQDASEIIQTAMDRSRTPVNDSTDAWSTAKPLTKDLDLLLKEIDEKRAEISTFGKYRIREFILRWLSNNFRARASMLKHWARTDAAPVDAPVWGLSWPGNTKRLMQLVEALANAKNSSGIAPHQSLYKYEAYDPIVRPVPTEIDLPYNASGDPRKDPRTWTPGVVWGKSSFSTYYEDSELSGMVLRSMSLLERYSLPSYQDRVFDRAPIAGSMPIFRHLEFVLKAIQHQRGNDARWILGSTEKLGFVHDLVAVFTNPTFLVVHPGNMTRLRRDFVYRACLERKRNRPHTSIETAELDTEELTRLFDYQTLRLVLASKEMGTMERMLHVSENDVETEEKRADVFQRIIDFHGLGIPPSSVDWDEGRFKADGLLDDHELVALDCVYPEEMALSMEGARAYASKFPEFHR